MSWNEFWELVARWSLTPGLTIVLTIIIMLVLITAARVVLGRLFRAVEEREKDAERAKRIRTLVTMFRKVIVIAIVAIGLLTIFSELGVDLGPVLTVIGLAGLAVSFGAQSLVKDVIGGLFILLENDVRIGDDVKIGAHEGLVEDITPRTLKLRDGEGNLHVIPHGTVTSLVNRSKK